MIVTYTKGQRVVEMAIDDARCDDLLDYLARNFQKPNPDADKRWEKMISIQEAFGTKQTLKR